MPAAGRVTEPLAGGEPPAGAGCGGVVAGAVAATVDSGPTGSDEPSVVDGDAVPAAGSDETGSAGGLEAVGCGAATGAFPTAASG